MDGQQSSAAPSALIYPPFSIPGLTAGPTHCRPYGPSAWKKSHIASFRRNRGVTWQFSTPGIARETLCHKAFRVSRRKLASHHGPDELREAKLEKNSSNLFTPE